MNPIQHLMGRAEMFEAIKSAIGRALTPAQQAAVSEKLVTHQTAFLDWLQTERGQATIRVMADAFAGGALETKTPTEVSDNR